KEPRPERTLRAIPEDVEVPHQIPGAVRPVGHDDGDGLPGHGVEPPAHGVAEAVGPGIPDEPDAGVDPTAGFDLCHGAIPATVVDHEDPVGDPLRGEPGAEAV